MMLSQFEAPDLAPVLVAERTPQGWRGITAEGEIYEVRARHVPERLCISDRHGRPIGYRELPKQLSDDGSVGDYLAHANRAVNLMQANALADALSEIERAIDIVPTTRAHFNRAQILLGLGRWREGFDAYEQCERLDPFIRPNYREALAHGLKPWRGEPLDGKRLLLVHDHGFGDTIMCLRFVPQLRAMGAEVVLMMPPELRRLAAQCAPVTANSLRVIDTDYFCPILHVLTWLKLTPNRIPPDPYLAVDPVKWRERMYPGVRKIGVAWSVGYQHEGDYQRAIPLSLIVNHLGRRRDTVEFISVQQQGRAEADTLGVANFYFDDFLDCAALMAACDEIVTVDTAAVHLAGAIGHPKVTLLLPHWASWRWLSSWYRNLRICRQPAPDDWASALAQC